MFQVHRNVTSPSASITSVLYFLMSLAEKDPSPERHRSCFCWGNSVFCYLTGQRGADSPSTKPGRVSHLDLLPDVQRPHLPHLPPSTNHPKEARYKALNEELEDGQWVSNNSLCPDLLDMQRVVCKYSHECVLLFTEWVCWVNQYCQRWLINKNRIPKNSPTNSFPTENQDNKAISNDFSGFSSPFWVTFNPPPSLQVSPGDTLWALLYPGEIKRELERLIKISTIALVNI